MIYFKHFILKVQEVLYFHICMCVCTFLQNINIFVCSNFAKCLEIGPVPRVNIINIETSNFPINQSIIKL